MKLNALLIGLAFALIWSSAFSSARIIVSEAPPLYSLALRFLISGLIGVAIARALGQPCKLSRQGWLRSSRRPCRLWLRLPGGCCWGTGCNPWQ